MLSSLTSIASVNIKINNNSSDQKLTKAFKVNTRGNFAVSNFPTNSPFRNQLNAFTFEAWCYSAVRGAGGQGFFGLGATNNYITIVYDEIASIDPGWRWSVCDQDTVYQISGKKIVSETDMPANQWTHVAVTRNTDASNNMRLFINGISENLQFPNDNAVTSHFTYSNFAGLVIGRAFTSGSDKLPVVSESYITGLRLSNVARYTSNFTPSKNRYIHDVSTIFAFNFDNTTNSFSSVNGNLTLNNNLNFSPIGSIVDIPAATNF